MKWKVDATPLVAIFTLTSGTILGARTRFLLHKRNGRLLSMDN